MSGDTPSQRALVLGASGTIGSAVVRELVAQGFSVTAFVRRGSDAAFEGAEIRYGDVTDPASMRADAFAETRFDVVISCLASRSGAPKDAEAIDCDANFNALDAAESTDAKHFILVSAICVQKPRLMFQRAKLIFETGLRSAKIDYTIIRPTAFFKSLSGQVERVAKGGRFMVFGDGTMTRCKPISDADLARFIVAQIGDPAAKNALRIIGGPGPAISPRDQAEMLGELIGRDVQTRRVPLGLFTVAEKLFALGANVSDWCAEKAEYARIARYYATESMLALDPETGEYSEELTPEYGTDTLREHYKMLIENA